MFLGQLPGGDDVGDRDATARLQDAEDLLDDLALAERAPTGTSVAEMGHRA